MTSMVYAALFIVVLGACGLGLLLAVLAETLSAMERHKANESGTDSGGRDPPNRGSEPPAGTLKP